jgi:type IX secretion system PorP/SprF family membrane protein
MLLLKNTYNRLALVILLFITKSVFSQDAHLSQFFSSPLTINPSNAGNFEGKFRFSSNYRVQWADFNHAFATTTLTAESPILHKKFNDATKVSLGAVVVNDASGNGLLTKQSMALGVAVRQYLDPDLNHSVAAGMQAGYVKMGFNASKAEFEDELSPTGFDLATSEALLFNGGRRSYFDFNVGLQYTGYFNNSFLLYTGVSAYHLNKSSMSFLDPSIRTPLRFNVNFGGYKSLGTKSYIHFSSQYQRQSEFQELIYGGAFEFILVNKNNLTTSAYLGMWMRNTDFIIPYFGFDWNRFRLGFSYDVGFINRTDLTYASYQTGEVSLVWLINNSENIKSLQCPKF